MTKLNLDYLQAFQTNLACNARAQPGWNSGLSQDWLRLSSECTRLNFKASSTASAKKWWSYFPPCIKNVSSYCFMIFFPTKNKNRRKWSFPSKGILDQMWQKKFRNCFFSFQSLAEFCFCVCWSTTKQVLRNQLKNLSLSCHRRSKSCRQNRKVSFNQHNLSQKLLKLLNMTSLLPKKVTVTLEWFSIVEIITSMSFISNTFGQIILLWISGVLGFYSHTSSLTSWWPLESWE